MRTGPRKTLRAALIGVRNLAVTIGIVGGAQLLFALLLWPALFRTYPQGFAMALSLVGFASWFLSSLGGLSKARLERRARSSSKPERESPSAAAPIRPLVDRVQSQVQQSGCGLVLFLSGLIPLALAFVLRVRADLNAGNTWRDIFPPVP